MHDVNQNPTKTGTDDHTQPHDVVRSSLGEQPRRHSLEEETTARSDQQDYTRTLVGGALTRIEFYQQTQPSRTETPHDARSNSGVEQGAVDITHTTGDTAAAAMVEAKKDTPQEAERERRKPGKDDEDKQWMMIPSAKKALELLRSQMKDLKKKADQDWDDKNRPRLEKYKNQRASYSGTLAQGSTAFEANPLPFG
jgi:hypothetical protein